METIVERTLVFCERKLKRSFWGFTFARLFSTGVEKFGWAGLTPVTSSVSYGIREILSCGSSGVRGSRMLRKVQSPCVREMVDLVLLLHITKNCKVGRSGDDRHCLPIDGRESLTDYHISW